MLVLLLESFVLSPLVMISVYILPVEQYAFKRWGATFIMVFFFFYFKLIYESWLASLVSIFNSRGREVKRGDLFYGKAISSFLMFLVLLSMAIDSSSSVDIFTVYALAYPLSVFIAYYLTKSYLDKAINWINKN